MLTENEIINFISEDKSSEKKHKANVGLRYYEGNHDILNYRLYYYNADGELVEDETRSNIKIPHPFFTELVDQQVQYLMSGGGYFVKSDIPELQDELNSYFNENENFISELYETLTGTVSKGFDYMYAYKTSEGQITFMNADSMGVVECDKKYTSDGKDYVIYYYLDRVDIDKRKITRIQVWDDAQTYFYIREDDGRLVPDPYQEINPRPHVLYKKDDSDDLYYETLGFIPFFRLDNNKKQITGLDSVKDLIDDYDLMSCGLSNNLQDASEYLVVVRGFQGDNLEELIKNVKTKKHIGVDGDGGGDVDFKTVDIPYQARKLKLDLDSENIYHFGFGLNLASIKDTAATTNIAIKSAYGLLDMKCRKFEVQLKKFLRKLLDIVLDEINFKLKTDYQQKDVYFDFRYEVPTNSQENAQIDLIEAQRKQVEINTMLGLTDRLDDETIIQNICETLDISYEDIRNRLPENETAKAAKTLEGLIPEGDLIE